MDNNTVLVVAVGLFALVLIVALIAFRKRVRGSIEGPLSTRMSIDASNPQPTLGATVEDANSRAGSVIADDLTGRGAAVRRAEAEKDIKATSREGSDPKA